MNHVPASSTADLVVSIVMVIATVGWLTWLYFKGVPSGRVPPFDRPEGRIRGRNRF